MSRIYSFLIWNKLIDEENKEKLIKLIKFVGEYNSSINFIKNWIELLEKEKYDITPEYQLTFSFNIHYVRAEFPDEKCRSEFFELWNNIYKVLWYRNIRQWFIKQLKEMID